MRRRLKLDATRSATITSVRTRSAVSVWAQNMIGRAMRQMHSGIWQSLTRSRRLIPGGLGDRHPHASALTGRTELSFETRRLESDPAQPGVPRQRAGDADRLLSSLTGAPRLFSVAPKIAERLGRKLRIAHVVPNIAVTQVVLD